MSPELQAQVRMLIAQGSLVSEAGTSSPDTFAKEKSILLDLVLDDFKQLRKSTPDLMVEEYCHKFACLGDALHNSIVRAIDVQNFVELHPEILGIAHEIEWPAIGARLDTFQVLDELGRGAWARVYLCREIGLGNRLVVVKVARGGEYEAEQLGKLDHRYIVPIYSVKHDWEHCVSYICMPFRGRSTLQEVVSSVSSHGIPASAAAILDISQQWSDAKDFLDLFDAEELSGIQTNESFENGVLRLGIEIANALNHAHRRDVLHGDLKPSNILLTYGGRPLLIDFNLSRNSNATRGVRGGTLAYMAPELLTEIGNGNDSHGGDVRSEVYSFGVVLFQLLTGQLPFEPDVRSDDAVQHAQRILAKIKTSIPQIGELNSAVNSGLQALVLDCLAADPAHRPQTMKRVVRSLERELRPHARLSRLARTYPKLSMGGAATLAFAVVAGTVQVANLPPYASRKHAQAMERVGSRDLYSALQLLDLSLDYDPLNSSARFDRARIKIALDDAPNAMKDLHVLSKSGDPRADACIAYCFNLENEPAAAILWYEKSLARGYSHWAVHNNLAMSYANGRSRLGHTERFEAAEKHLRLALSLQPDQAVVYNNLVKVALLRRIDPSYDLRSSTEDVRQLLSIKPDHPQVLSNCAQFYSHLSRTDSAYDAVLCDLVERELRLGVGPTLEVLETAPNYAAIRRSPKFPELRMLSLQQRPISLNGAGMRTYVEPAPLTKGLPQIASR